MSFVSRVGDDGLPLISHVCSFRTSKGEIWRVRYRCGDIPFQITQLQGFCVLSWLPKPGISRERKYTTFDRAYKGILSLRRKLCA